MSRQIKRCKWPKNDALYLRYHDREWGIPVYEDHKIFEFMLLETFQAGLSWITILRRRENFRTAFDNFDFQKIANYSDEKLEELKQDVGIIRNRLKIKAAKTNAIAFMEVQKEFGTFSKYLWGFVGGKPIQNHFKTISELPANTPISDKISADLKNRGFKFVGSTIIYAHMQAMGMVNDHTTDCFRYNEV
jgi:DNA-3-methyladenine glycosylase I